MQEVFMAAFADELEKLSGLPRALKSGKSVGGLYGDSRVIANLQGKMGNKSPSDNITTRLDKMWNQRAGARMRDISRTVSGQPTRS